MSPPEGAWISCPSPMQTTAKPRRGRESLGHFAARAAPWAALVLALFAYVGTRYRIGIDVQANRCLPQVLYLVDRDDRRVARGKLYAFTAPPAMRPFFPQGQLVIKRATGIAGDRIEVGADHTRVNGRDVGSGLALAKALHRAPASFERALRLREGTVWMMGESRDSFDARYWGALQESRIIGRVYALF